MYEHLREVKPFIFGAEHNGEDVRISKEIQQNTKYEGFPPMLQENVRIVLKRMWEKGITYKFHIVAFNHMASSQTACVNLFAYILDSEYADEILRVLDVCPKDFSHIDRNRLYRGFCFEYWKENASEQDTGWLNDHTPAAGTDSDVAIAYINKSGESCLWIIEHKLTEEEFTTCGARKLKTIDPKVSEKSRKNAEANNAEKIACMAQSCTQSFANLLQGNYSQCYYWKHCHYGYWKYAAQLYKVIDSDCPFKGGMNQLWRNQALAEALVENKQFARVTFSVVTHPQNDAPMLNESMRQYEQMLIDPNKFSHFTSLDIVKSVRQLPIYNQSTELKSWCMWYSKVYNIL